MTIQLGMIQWHGLFIHAMIISFFIVKKEGTMTKSKGSTLFSKLQTFGPTMMLVIAIIPVGGLLLGLGVFMQNETFMADFPILQSQIVYTFSSLIRGVGNMIIGNLHILFAIAVAEGLSDHDGVAGFAAAVGFLTFNTVIGSILGLTAENVSGSNIYTTILGIPTLQTGVFGGICIGLMVAFLYKKFKGVKFPQGLAFFQGKRFVPIISLVGAIVLGVVFSLVWPQIQNAIISFSTTIGDTTNPLTLYVFGLINRLLVPFGLHNIWYPIFYFQVGTYTNLAGQVIVGDLNIYLAQLADGVPITHGLTSGGCYLFPGFCIAAALAITKMAKPENRKKTLGLFTAGIVTIIFTGITEPIEFVFLFTCFPLYIIHAFFMALSFPILCLLDIHVGSTFCGGLMDWLVYGVLQDSPGWQWIIPLNIIVGIIYYFIFKALIKVFNFKTPGREDEIVEVSDKMQKEDVLAAAVLNALGGKENITVLDACATRLRVTVVSRDKVSKDTFRVLGASGTMQNGNDYQIIFGTQASLLKDQIKAIMEGYTVSGISERSGAEKAEDVAEEIVFPVTGELLELDQVPDRVFADGMMGCGFAVRPEEGTVVSPVNGKVENIMPTEHAICIVSDMGKEIMIHMGIDTVKMDGAPFEISVKEGQLVEAGQRIAKMDLDMIREKAPSDITPVIFTNMDSYSVVLDKKGILKAGTERFFHFQEKEVI